MERWLMKQWLTASMSWSVLLSSYTYLYADHRTACSLNSATRRHGGPAEFGDNAPLLDPVVVEA